MKKLLTTPKDLYDGFAKAIDQLKDGGDGVHYWRLATHTSTLNRYWKRIILRTTEFSIVPQNEMTMKMTAQINVIQLATMLQ